MKPIRLENAADLLKVLDLFNADKRHTSEQEVTCFKFVGRKTRQSPNVITSLTPGWTYTRTRRKFLYYHNDAVISMPRNKVNSNPVKDCGPGIHVSTLAWARANASKLNRNCAHEGLVIISLKVKVKDIVAIPHSRGELYGKFRVCEAKVMRKVEYLS